MPQYTRDIVQVDKDWLKGRLQEGVVDSEGNVICVCSEDGEAAALIAKLLSDHYRKVKSISN